MSQDLTYGTLDKTLTILEFESRKVDENHLAYFNREHDVLFTLPLAEYHALVSPRHISVVRRMITEKGVATEEKLEAVIQDVIKETKAENAKNGADLLDLQELFPSIHNGEWPLGKLVQDDEAIQQVGA